jgi:hypothetical protein
MNTHQIKKMAELFNYRPKFTIGLAELMFGIYSITATTTRPLIPTFLIAVNVNEFETMYISFIFSFSVTSLFLSFSMIKKMDWYGKKEKGLIFFIINKFNRKRILLILFLLDSFLFFIYYKKNNNKYRTVLLFTLSSVAITLMWEAFAILSVKLIGVIF